MRMTWRGVLASVRHARDTRDPGAAERLLQRHRGGLPPRIDIR